MAGSNQKRILVLGKADSDQVKALMDAGNVVETVDSIAEAAEKLTSGIYAQFLADSNTIAMLGLSKRSEEEESGLDALRESEEMYRNLIERSNDGVVVLQDGLIKFANPRFEELSGYPADILLNTPFTTYLTPDEIATLYKRYEQRMAGEYVPPIYEMVLTRSDASKIQVEISAAIVSFQGRPADLVLVRDIRERKKAEEYLQRYRLLSESARDIILFVGLDGKIIEANRAAVETYGYSHDELLNMSIYDLRSEEERELVAEQLVQAQSGGILFETTHHRKDGSTFPVEVSSRGTVIGDERVLLGIIHDITERKQAEAVLDGERRRLRFVLDAMPVAVFIVDANGRFLEANEQADKIWGGPVPHVERIAQYGEYRSFWPDTNEPVAPEDRAMSRALIKGETVVGMMVRIKRFDGGYGTVLDSAAPIRDAEGRIIGGIATEQDITELVRLREALERSLDETRRESWRASALEGIAEAGLSIIRLPDLLTTLVERIARALNVDASCVFVLDEEAGEFEAHAEYNVPGLLGCRIKMSEGLIGKVASEAQPIYVADAENDPLAVDSCKIRAVAKSLLGVPLIARGKVVGVTRVQSLVAREFTEDEVHLLQAIADRVAMAIDNAKLYDALQRSRREISEALERERHFSMLLQRALLPEKPSVGEGYNIAVRYEPVFTGREVGGDFYDVFKSGQGWAGILIGDVSGKGLEAASLAVTTRSTIHAFVHETPFAGEVLTRSNSVIYYHQPNAESFVTIMLVVINPSTGDLIYSTAGHPPGVVLRVDGNVEFLPFANLPLGVSGSSQYQQFEDHLNPGDKLVLYTDGISEAHAEAGLFDLEGIRQTLSGHSNWTADEIADRLVTAATEWANGKLRDDAAVVVVERQR